MFLEFKKSIITFSRTEIGVFKYGFLSGCSIRDLIEFSTARLRTSARWKELAVFNFSETERINALFCLFFPCLTCNPFNAKL